MLIVLHLPCSSQWMPLLFSLAPTFLGHLGNNNVLDEVGTLRTLCLCCACCV
jgi:hypothetical protein